jgi:pimeloyl-ACP methyl ester carboxylesterase
VQLRLADYTVDMRIAVVFASLLTRTALTASLLLTAATVAVAAPATLAPSRFNNGIAVDTAAIGTRIPVLLVHGLGGSGQGWENFLQAYAQNPAWRGAFKPYTFKYSSSSAEVLADPAAPRTITGLGAALRDNMQSFYDRPASESGFANKPVIVIAHSMGGLVARSMMQEHSFRDGRRGGQKVLHLITLGTPHHGTQLADAAITLGLQSVNELSEGYFGFVSQMTWTNFDGLDSSSARCNPWLAQLNNYAPATGADYGRCGGVPADPRPGYYDRIIAYGAGSLQSRDFDFGGAGVYRPGSSASLLLSYSYLHDTGLPRSYRNDGMVPIASAQFTGAALWDRREAFGCDHRYLERGYQEFVRTSTFSYTDWAFCAGTSSRANYPSGTSGGYAWSGSILGVPGGIIEAIRTVSETERVLDWAEQEYAGLLQPAGAATELWDGYYVRSYPGTQAHVGVKDGNVYYKGPATHQQIEFVATLATFLARAQAAGF